MRAILAFLTALLALPAYGLEPMQDESLQSESFIKSEAPMLPPVQPPEYPSHSRPFPTEKISLEQWQVYLAQKMNETRAKISEDQSTLKVSSPSVPADYIFTKPVSPAYPAAELRIYTKDKKSLTITWLYAGSSEEFEKWRLQNKTRWPLL